VEDLSILGNLILLDFMAVHNNELLPLRIYVRDGAKQVIFHKIQI
jgi:hypothetical protein